jgi:hypothetical protein
MRSVFCFYRGSLFYYKKLVVSEAVLYFYGGDMALPNPVASIKKAIQDKKDKQNIVRETVQDFTQRIRYEFSFQVNFPQNSSLEEKAILIRQQKEKRGKVLGKFFLLLAKRGVKAENFQILFEEVVSSKQAFARRISRYFSSRKITTLSQVTPSSGDYFSMILVTIRDEYASDIANVIPVDTAVDIVIETIFSPTL